MLALASVFKVGKAHLADAWLGSDSEGVFSTSEDVFGVALATAKNWAFFSDHRTALYNLTFK